MKYLTVIIGILAFQLSVYAQSSEKQISSGEIVYEQIMKLDIQIEGDGAQFADLMPKEKRTKNILTFNENASLYKTLSENKEEMNDSENKGIVIQINEPQYSLYTDFLNNIQTEQREFMTRQFLIEKELDAKGWKLSGNNKEILGYNCQEALKDDGKKHIRAWFTAEIPVSTGPGQILGLPGAVLAADIDEGQLIIEAKKITEKEIVQNDIVKPKKGKKVTQEEFDKIVDDKMKEMGAEGDGNGNHVIMKIQIEE